LSKCSSKWDTGGSRREAGEAIGRAGDEGIDGIITEDRLGLDVIYLQAKKWEGTVGWPEIQKFVGALHGKRAKKGIFMTTGTFSSEAAQYVANNGVHATRKRRARVMPRVRRDTAVKMSSRTCASLMFAFLLLLDTSACWRGTTPLPERTRADRIVLEKSARRLTLVANGTELRSYRVALGRNPEGPKLREGDNRTPEGSYVVAGHNDNSGYHRALRISYPNAHDREVAKAAGVSPGGDIMIHGIRNGFGWVGPFHRLVDWTRGCIAVTDDEIEEIARVVPDGAVVEIRP
jgi:hypothetical protein